MSKYKIAWLPGDGVGQDVMEAAKIVLDRIDLDAEYIHGDIGWEFWCHEGEALPQRTLDLMKETDCAMFGAITSKGRDVADLELDPELKGKGYVYRSPIVRMRQVLDLYICLRPTKAYAGNPLNYKDGIDLVIFRENTEGMYIGVEYASVPEEFYAVNGMDKIPRHAAISLRAITPEGSERIVRAAFEHAVEHGRKRVTAVHKGNVLRQTDGVFMEAARKVAAEYPGIQFDNANIDAMGMWLLKNPFNYEVIVTTNLFGDIISDLCAQMVGGLGFGCSGNIGANYAVFEPTHGSAPKYAGQYKVNPIATILAAKMMLDWLGEKDKAAQVEEAVAAVIAEGKVRTYDMGGSAGTLDVARAIAGKL
ncbi:MAG: isocitrate/isopropylmalate dehydrogenase family protein [Anaerolineae bacterium]|nr:isocitrate/isopropylmalate dehydrogenase family protein [Anaerolineae bacterium]MDX9829395.1 isocitrate/isopropylmalate dehydrogenase family protein [Anaerolineae bacterium]